MSPATTSIGEGEGEGAQVPWAIYYASGARVIGHDAAAWRDAPDDGVQVVVLYAPYPTGRRPWRGVDDRQLWTGEDVYDPFGYGAKRGAWMDRAVYELIWERACGDARP